MKKVMVFVSLAFLLLSIQFANAAKPIRTHEQMIADNLQDGNPIWLGKGKSKFLAVYKEASTPHVYGAYLLLPDRYANPDWTLVISPLRRALTNYGWATLSISLPKSNSKKKKKTQVAQVPVDSSSDASNGNQGNGRQVSIDFGPGEKAIEERINDAMAFLERKQYRNIIILGHGTGALWASIYVMKHHKSKTKIRGIVLLSTYFPKNKSNQKEFNKLIANIKVPILDIYATQDFAKVKRLVKLRMMLARRDRNTHYWARIIQGTNHYYIHSTDSLIKTIRAWMYHKEGDLKLKSTGIVGSG